MEADVSSPTQLSQSPAMTAVEFEFEGRRYKGFVARKGSDTWYHVDGRTWKETTNTRRRSSAGTSTLEDPGLVKAPMPGKIVKLMKAVGAEVKAGEVVVVMEAMKMEYTLKSASDGRITEIRCSVGEQVSLGTELVRLEINS